MKLNGVTLVKHRKRRKLKKKVKIVLAIIGVFVIAILWMTNVKKEQDTVTADSESTKVEKGTKETEEKEVVKTTTKAGQTLFDEIAELDSNYLGNIGFVLLNKSSNEMIEVNADTVFTSASLYKLYITYAILTEVDKGNLSLDATISNQTTATIDSYLRDTITLSVNETAIALADIIGWDVIEKFVQENGFSETTFNTTIENGIAVRGTLQTTPKNVTDLLNRLMEGTLLSETSTDYFMGLLADQQLNYALPTGLSEDIRFAHKTGILDSVSHDAGILTDSKGQEYVVVVMSDGWSYAYEEAKPVFTETGQSIMNYLSEQ